MEVHSNTERTQVCDSKLNIISLVDSKLRSRELEIRVNYWSGIPRNRAILPGQNNGVKYRRSVGPLHQAGNQKQESSNGELHNYI